MAPRRLEPDGPALITTSANGAAHRHGHTPDVVVVGASAGGVEALTELIGGLPEEFPARIFVVLHILSTGRSMLPAILERCGGLPASVPVDGEHIDRGHIYVAPPDHHMLVKKNHVKLTRGPRENGHRPAVDPLFRSAARTHGPRVIGIVLSGSQDDGTAGLRFIKEHGGMAIAQDPAEAIHGEMPENAIENVAVDHVAPVGAMPALLESLVEQEVDGEFSSAGDEPDQAEDRPSSARMKQGAPSTFSCPECGGVLWEQSNGNLKTYRCQVGHAYSAESLVTEQGKSVETALWTAARSLEERAELLRRLGRRSRNGGLIARFESRADAATNQAEVLRETIELLASDVGAEDG